VSASLDGTVRAFDLVRYRNFRTFTAATPVQFISLATDEAGEVVCAGGMDPFSIFVWSTQTGKLLDVLAGHEGPVCSLSFNGTLGLLASGSWDKTVKLWDVFRDGTSTETFRHGSDVTAVSFRPDGKQLCASTLDGYLHFWDARKGIELGSIDGRRDAAGGRKHDDVRTAKASAARKSFSSVAYSADGECVIAGGRTKYICLYAVEPKMLLKKWQISHNRSVDGILDKLNSKNVGEAGPLALLDLEDRDDMEARKKYGPNR
jgi:periodic tryptophan protein 2